MTPELKQFDTSARDWLSSSGLPVNLGNSLIATITKTLQSTNGMSTDQLAGYAETEYTKLEGIYGAGLEDKLRSAAVMIHALDQKTPGLKKLLKSKGIGDNAMVVAQLVQAATVWHARRKGR